MQPRSNKPPSDAIRRYWLGHAHLVIVLLRRENDESLAVMNVAVYPLFVRASWRLRMRCEVQSDVQTVYREPLL